MSNQIKKVKINFDKLSDKDRQLLVALFKSDDNIYIYEKNEVYPVTLNGKKYNIQLNHNILRRHRRKKPDQYRFEVIGEEIGRGGEGIVYRILATLALRRNDTLLVKTRKKRILKIEMLQKYLNERFNQYAELIRKSVPHLGSKEPIKFNEVSGDFTAHTIMRFLGGKHLGLYVRNFASKTEYLELTVDERLDISLNILKAILKQAHDQHVLHQDIKFENILVDEDTKTINLIDYSSAKYTGTETSVYVAVTRGTIAPEQLLSKNSNELSDMYAAGIVLGQLWDIYSPQDAKSRSDYPALFIDGNSLKHFNLIPEHRKILLDLFNRMTQKKVAERDMTIPLAIEIIEQVQLQRKLQKVTDRKLKNEIITAYGAAKVAREQIKDLDVNSPKEIILSGMEEFDSTNTLAREQFFKTLDVHCFNDLKNTEEIKNRFDDVDDMINQSKKMLLDWRASLTSVADKGKNEAEKLEADIFLEDVEELIDKCNRKNLSMDERYELSLRIQDLTEELNLDAIYFYAEQDQFELLKTNIKYIVAKYLFEHQRKPNLSEQMLKDKSFDDIILDYQADPKQYKMSTNNTKAVNKILELLNKPLTSDQLIQALKHASQKADHGFFNKSRLVGYIDHVIKGYTAEVEKNVKQALTDQKTPSPR